MTGGFEFTKNTSPLQKVELHLQSFLLLVISVMMHMGLNMFHKMTKT